MKLSWHENKSTRIYITVKRMDVLFSMLVGRRKINLLGTSAHTWAPTLSRQTDNYAWDCMHTTQCHISLPVLCNDIVSDDRLLLICAWSANNHAPRQSKCFVPRNKAALPTHMGRRTNTNRHTHIVLFQAMATSRRWRQEVERSLLFSHSSVFRWHCLFMPKSASLWTRVSLGSCQDALRMENLQKPR